LSLLCRLLFRRKPILDFDHDQVALGFPYSVL
jgi:hypothetical protein